MTAMTGAAVRDILNRREADEITIYFNLDQRGEFTELAVKETIEKLQKMTPDNIDLEEYGDRFMLSNRYSDQTLSEIQSQFGEEFSKQLMKLEPGKWQGPVASGYGLHAVFVTKRTTSG